MNKQLYKEFTDYIYNESGITLNENKQSLLENRIQKRMRVLQILDPAAYLAFVKADKTFSETVRLIDVISTNVTSFFREMPHFDFLRTLLSEWLERGKRKFRVWCAASSTGEEPYTIAMELLEATEGYSVDTRILATDISTIVLQKAQLGEYNKEKCVNIPAQLKSKYFESCAINGEPGFKAQKEMKELISFCRLNLSKPPFPMKGPMDIVFIRNVMIYFDDSVKAALLTEVYRLLAPGGILIIGHSESMAGTLVPGFKRIGNSIFVRE